MHRKTSLTIETVPIPSTPSNTPFAPTTSEPQIQWSPHGIAVAQQHDITTDDVMDDFPAHWFVEIMPVGSTP